ncbi:hypothetical protein SLA2020_216510 [Shorea laevis]
MSVAGAFNALKSSTLISWESTGKLQQTLAACVERTGSTLHSGTTCTVKLWPEFAGRGRYFDLRSKFIPASIHCVQESPLCTTLAKDGCKIRTVEHLLSALEAMGVDNCRIQIDSAHHDVEVPIFDGSASAWVEAIEQVGLEVAVDHCGNNAEKMAPSLKEPVHVQRKDSFMVAFPCERVCITYGINFPQVPAIGCQWFSAAFLEHSFYAKHIACSRTFCIFEEVERMRNAGLIKGGSLDNAIVCSSNEGWLNPPLRFHDEPCRHKVLDLIGDLSLFAQSGSQGLPVAHILCFKGGHALHADFARLISGGSKDCNSTFEL